MLTNSSLFFGALWALADTLVIIGGGFRIYLKIVRKLDHIEYALFNDGNGVVQKVSELHENQQAIKTDIAVMKTKVAARKTRSAK